MASVLNIKNSMPGLSFIKYCPRSWLVKCMLISFCRSCSPLMSIPTSFLTVLLAPSVPIRKSQWNFFSARFPSLVIEAVTVTLFSVVMGVHSCPKSICCSASFTSSELRKPSLLTWNPMCLSCSISNLVSLCWEKWATETGLTILSKSAYNRACERDKNLKNC